MIALLHGFVAASFFAVGSDVAQVLADAREALGWDAVERAAAVRVRGDARLLGTAALQTELFDARGRWVQTFEGPLPQQAGSDGTTQWSVDWSGTPRVMELGDRVRGDVGALFLSGRWVVADTLVFDAVSAHDGALELTFHHTEGPLSGTVELDAETSLPRRASWGEGSERATWTFTGYTDHEGFRFPAEIRLEQSGTVQSLTTRDVDLLATVADDRFAPRLDRPRDTRFVDDAPATLEVKRVRTGHLLVRPSIDGEELGWFIFDTGAGTNCISTHVAGKLAEGPFGEIPARGVGGTVLSHFWRAEKLELGPLVVEDPVFMGLDLEFLEAPFGVEVAGILGYELLSRCVVELDLAGDYIGLFAPDAYELDPAGAWEEAVLYERTPCVRAEFEGHTGLFRLDTGATGTVTLHQKATQELDLVRGRETTPASSGGVGGTVPVLVGHLASFRLGGHAFGSIPAHFALEDKGAFGDDYTAGNIGGDLLRPFLLVFDYPNRRLGFVLEERD